MTPPPASSAALELDNAFDAPSSNDNDAAERTNNVVPINPLLSADEKLLADNPDLAAKAQEIGLSSKATIQFIRQSLMLKEAEQKASAENKRPDRLSQAHQHATQPTKTHRKQARATDNGGHKGVFASYNNVFCFV
jgi:hypothetical protein